MVPGQEQGWFKGLYGCAIMMEDYVLELGLLVHVHLH